VWNKIDVKKQNFCKKNWWKKNAKIVVEKNAKIVVEKNAKIVV